MSAVPPGAAEGTITRHDFHEDLTDMTDHDDVAQRAYHSPDPGRVHLREDDADDGVFSVRMPIVTTGEVRNPGDEPFDRDELDGMREQIEDRSIGVFLDHGMASIGGSRYSATEKLGEWEDPALETNGGETELVANARLMDPETLPEAAGPVREALTALREQVARDMSLSASVGWRDDESFPGGHDLTETSIVGIGADPRTTSDSPGAAMARAVAAGQPDADPEQLVEDFRAEVMGSDTRDGDEMTDDNTDNPGDDPGDGDRDGQDDDGAEEFRDFMREQTETQTEILRTLSDAIREDNDDEDDDDDGGDNADDDGDGGDGDGGDGGDGDDDDDDDDDGDRSFDLEQVPEDIRSRLDADATAEDVVAEMRDAYDDAEPQFPDGGGEDGDESDGGQRDSDPRDLL